MRLHSISLLFLFLFSPIAHAGNYFTTVFYDDEGVVFAGLKQGDGAGESHVIAFPFPSGERTRILLPEEISHRDVIGLVTEKKKLFVLTNGTGAKGDGPMLHMFDRGRNRWSKIGKIDCPAFTKVNISAAKMVFFCETGVTTRKGKSTVVAKTLSLGRERIYRTGTYRFPEFMLRFKGVTLLLEGRAPTWDKLRVKSSEVEKVYNAEDLLSPPAPIQEGGPAAANPED